MSERNFWEIYLSTKDYDLPAAEYKYRKVFARWIADGE
jgi:hypothetical protein